MPISNTGRKSANDVNSILAAGAIRVGSKLGDAPQSGDLSRYIDHTLLKPEATKDEIELRITNGVIFVIRDVNLMIKHDLFQY